MARGIHLNGTDNAVTLSDVCNMVEAREILKQNRADGWHGEIHLNGTDNAVTLSDVYNVVHEESVTALDVCLNGFQYCFDIINH